MSDTRKAIAKNIIEEAIKILHQAVKRLEYRVEHWENAAPTVMLADLRYGEDALASAIGDIQRARPFIRTD